MGCSQGGWQGREGDGMGAKGRREAQRRLKDNYRLRSRI